MKKNEIDIKMLKAIHKKATDEGSEALYTAQTIFDELPNLLDWIKRAHKIIALVEPAVLDAYDWRNEDEKRYQKYTNEMYKLLNQVKI